MDDIIYYAHYIRKDAESRITHGFSDTFEQPLPGDVCITEQGSYQFRLFPDGEENPPLRDDYGVPLYKWDGTAVVKRTPQEIEADRPEPIETLDPVAFIQGFADALSEYRQNSG